MYLTAGVPGHHSFTSLKLRLAVAFTLVFDTMEAKVRTISYLNEGKEFDIRLTSGSSVYMVQDPS